MWLLILEPFPCTFQVEEKTQNNPQTNLNHHFTALKVLWHAIEQIWRNNPTIKQRPLLGLFLADLMAWKIQMELSCRASQTNSRRGAKENSCLGKRQLETWEARSGQTSSPSAHAWTCLASICQDQQSVFVLKVHLPFHGGRGSQSWFLIWRDGQLDIFHRCK